MKHLDNIHFKTIISVLLLVLSVFLIIISMSITQFTEKEIYNYESKGNIDYDLYAEEIKINEDELIGNNIDTIRAKIAYYYLADQRLNINDQSMVVANIDVTDDNMKIWSKEILLDQKQESLTNVNGYKYLKLVELDYQYYLDLVKQNVNDYDSYDATLTIRYQTNMNANYNQNNENTNYIGVTSLEIPLTESKLSLTHNNLDVKDSVIGLEKSKIKNIFIFLVGLIILISSIITIIMDFISVLDNERRIQKHRKKVKKIIKNFDRFKRVKRSPELSDKVTRFVNEIGELKSIASLNNNEIIIYEKIKYEETWFMLVLDNEVYIYVCK